LLDELIDAKAFDELPSRQSFVLELAARTERLPADDPERQVEALRQFQKVAVFTVALADLTGRLPLMKVSDRLTDIAELIIQCCMDLAWQQMTDVAARSLLRRSGSGAAPGARGRGRLRQTRRSELGYVSDLDLVFLHDSSGEIQQTKARVRSTTRCSSCGSGGASCTCSPCTRRPAVSTKWICVCGPTARVVFS
jgi:glutamate-ammonia-ligase adenylyltransferase